VVGKDILKFHTLLWPAMLMAAGVEPPKRVFGHGFVNAKADEKMSKSKGNVVDPRELLERFGGNPDPLRFYLLSESDFGLDALFSFDALVTKYNADLADKLGNLLARTLTMVEKYLDGVVSAPGALGPEDESVRAQLLALFEPSPHGDGRTIYEQLVDDGAFAQLLQRVFASVIRMNGYVTGQQPWALAKDPAKKEQLATVLYVLCEGLRIVAAQLHPFIPRTSAKVWEQLGLAGTVEAVPFEQQREWGYLRESRVRRGEILFPKIQTTE
jgi:methionyl-tRNA synthetase